MRALQMAIMRKYSCQSKIVSIKDLLLSIHIHRLKKKIYYHLIGEKLKTIKEIRAYCGFDLVQLHGDETPRMCASLMPHVIKAFQLKDASSLSVLETYVGKTRAFLFDTYSKRKRGGTGQTFDWKLALEGKRHGVPVILSGGLSPDNVKDAIKMTAPFAVDIGTGVEESPGKKDVDQMKRLMKTLAS